MRRFPPFHRVTIALVLGLLTATAVGWQRESAVGNKQTDALLADLWVQTSAEYVACCLQTYRGASERVEREARRIYEEEAKLEAEFRGLPPAVVMDLDETVLDNGTYQTYLYDTGKEHSTELFCEFVTKYRKSIRLVPGAKDFISRAEAAGVTVIYITNRPESIREATIATLAQWGVNTAGLEDPQRLRLLCKVDESRKTPRRDEVRAKYRVLAMFGDQMEDFTDEFALVPGDSLAARRKAVDEYRNMWGTRWFILPNPCYGDWRDMLGNDPEKYLRRAGKME